MPRIIDRFTNKPELFIEKIVFLYAACVYEIIIHKDKRGNINCLLSCSEDNLDSLFCHFSVIWIFVTFKNTFFSCCGIDICSNNISKFPFMFCFKEEQSTYLYILTNYSQKKEWVISKWWINEFSLELFMSIRAWTIIWGAEKFHMIPLSTISTTSSYKNWLAYESFQCLQCTNLNFAKSQLISEAIFHDLPYSKSTISTTSSYKNWLAYKLTKVFNVYSVQIWIFAKGQ